ncbi:MAG: hypothetical protein N2544_13875 [Burkholderiales bacterium]|nr:hypothetical protein [Burkholderiales bacterium]
MTIATAVLVAGSAGAALGQAQPIEATTASGDKVRLLPDGRWEYVDPRKQAAMPKPAAPAAQAPASGPAQGGLFGIGRTIQPGDPDYNRGSLNPRGR